MRIKAKVLILYFLYIKINKYETDLLERQRNPSCNEKRFF